MRTSWLMAAAVALPVLAAGGVAPAPGVATPGNASLADPGVSAGGVDVRTFGADGSDGRDDTAALQAAVDFAAANRRAAILPAGTYLVNAVAESTSPKTGGVVLPSHTTLVLQPGAILKVIPNGSYAYQALLVRDVDDVRILGGGVIRCDRAEHDFRTAPKGRSTHEWGHGVLVSGARDVLVQGLTIEGCTGDAILVGAIGHIPSGNYVPSERVRILDNRLDASRRNNLSITGCDGVIVERNVITRAGWNDGIHDGTAPRFGIDIEGYGEGAVDFATPLNVIVRGNLLRENRGQAIGNYNGYGVVIDGNVADTGIGYGYGTETVISNNVIKESPANPAKFGVVGLGVSGGLATNSAVVLGNTIVGFDTGVDARGRDVVVASNVVRNARKAGVLAYAVENARIDGNLIADAPVGIRVAANASRVSVTDNTITRATTHAIHSDGKETAIRANRLDDATTAVRVSSGSARIEENSIDARNVSHPGVAVVIEGGVEATVRGNTFTGLKNGAILGGADAAVRIAGNRLERFDSDVPAIVVAGARRVELLDNVIATSRASTAAVGISLSGTDGAVVARNVVYAESGEAPRVAITTARAKGSTVVENVTPGGALETHASDRVERNTVGALERGDVRPARGN